LDPWLRIREILERALELAPEQRLAFVADACAGDAGLQSEVEQYLRYQDEAEPELSLHECVAGDSQPADELSDPERIGVYRILRRIGEGGMGIVYLAEREDGEYRQQVALKALKSGSRLSRMSLLFRRERQILAQLQHPNIARLMDGGTIGEQIYYVMEYIDGSPVTAYCTANHLSIRQRLKIFCEICDAVSYAHRKLVIHRDLKPENILVTTEGVPKLLDFGLAKLFHESAQVEFDSSVTIGPMLTPAYASPEQVRGEHLSTATDVYSLGVLLYELLSGRNPQAYESHSPIEVCRTILEVQPPPPSRAEQGTRNRHLTDDLDNISLMALRKEPDRRYASVDDLRADIERLLAGFPVRASRDSITYRARKYFLRHRWGMAASLVAFLAAFAAVTAIWWEGRQAERRFNEVRALAHSVIFEIHDSIRRVPGTLGARKLIVERGLAYLKSLEASRPREKEMQLELAAAYLRIAEAQSSSIGGLGDSDGALESYRAARRLLESVLHSHPNDIQALEFLSNIDFRIAGVLEVRGEESSRREAGQQAAALEWRLAKLAPEVPKYRAKALFYDAYNLSMLGDWKSAYPLLQQASALLETALLQAPGDEAMLHDLIADQEAMGQACNILKNPPGALEHFKRTTELRSQILTRNPKDTQSIMFLAYDLIDLGWVEHNTGQQKQAIADEQRSIELQESLAAADPQDWTARTEVAKSLVTLGLTYRDGGDFRNAIECLSRAAGIFAASASSDPGSQSTIHYQAWAATEIGRSHVEWAQSQATGSALAQREWRLALVSYEQAARLLSHYQMDTRLQGILDDRALRAAVPKGLAQCRRHVEHKPSAPAELGEQ
jgi:serine/threonine protein kinase